MSPDLQTQIVGLNFNARRRTKMLPDTVTFEQRNLDGTFTLLGSATDGWIMDEVIGETFGGPAVEYQFLFVWSADRDDLVRFATVLNVAGTRYEKRASDPAVGSPAVIRVRAQTITGYARI